MSIRLGNTLVSGILNLPQQTGKSGKFLETDGENANWIDVVRKSESNPTILTAPIYSGEFYLNTTSKVLFQHVGNDYHPFTIHGSPTVENNVYSNFTNDNYIVADDNATAANGEYVVKFTTGAIEATSNPQVIMHMEYGLAVEIKTDGSTLYCYNWQTSSSMTILENITANTTYWVKTIINGTSKVVSISTDGTTYTEKLNYTDTGLAFGNYNLTFGAHSRIPALTDRAFKGSIDFNDSYVKDLSGNYLWKNVAPYQWQKVSATSIDESNLVHKSEDETITGTKTFENVNNLLFNSNTTSNITPSVTSIGATPFARDYYHDHFAFKNNGMTIYSQETSTDGETWTTATKTLDNLFIWKDTVNTQILTTTEKAFRFTLYSSGYFYYSQIQWMEMGVAYTSPFSAFDVLIETSTDNTTWTTMHSSNITKNSVPVFLKTPSFGAIAYIRFTFTKTTNIDTGSVNINSLKAWTTRKGNQGLGYEYEKPYDWDVNRSIYPRSDNVSSLGLSGRRWKNIYGTTITGTTVNGTNVNGTTVNGTTLKANGYNVEAETVRSASSNLNNYPYHRIAHIELDGSSKQYYDATMIIDMSVDNTSSRCGQVKIDTYCGSKTQSPYSRSTATWMYRQGYSEDTIQVAYYTYTDTEGSGATTKAYIDVFYKCPQVYDGSIFRIRSGHRGFIDSTSRYTLIPTSIEGADDTTLTEVYNAIQGTSEHNAAHELHEDVQYTTIITASDGATVKEAKQFNMIDLTSQTVSLNNCWVATNASTQYYKVTSFSGSSSITDKPITENDHFTLCSETVRYANSTDYRIKQTYNSSEKLKTYVRWCNCGTWSSWNESGSSSVSSDTYTILASDWDSSTNSVNVTVEGVTSDSNVMVTPAATMSNMETYSSCKVFASTLSTDTVTFVCETIPTTAIYVVIGVM